MQRIIFITGGLTQPRVIKRVKSFYDRGIAVTVYGFDRGTFQNVNVLPREIEVHCLGEIENGKKYWSGFLLNKRKIVEVFKLHSQENVLYYSFGFVPALITMLYSNKKYVYEISDLIYGYFNSAFLRVLFKYVDKIIIRNSKLTVLTSAGFQRYFYGKNGKKSNVLVQANMLDETFNKVKRSVNLSSSDEIRFSFIGFLRYPNTIFRFAEIIGKYYPHHSFYFYGDSIFREKATELANRFKNIHYYGKFRNPEDLAEIYANIDVVVACYDTTTFNEKVAEPNKLYESLFFCKPIIVSKNTFLSERVSELDCGYSIDASLDDNIVKFINSIDKKKIRDISNHIYRMNNDFFIDNPSKLIDMLI